MAEKSTHQKLVEAGKKGAEARWGEEKSSRSESGSSEMSSHEKHVEAGRKGGEAEHECRGRECTHPSHRK